MPGERKFRYAFNSSTTCATARWITPVPEPIAGQALSPLRYPLRAHR
jgi:hypothetical protein